MGNPAWFRIIAAYPEFSVTPNLAIPVNFYNTLFQGTKRIVAQGGCTEKLRLKGVYQSGVGNSGIKSYSQR